MKPDCNPGSSFRFPAVLEDLISRNLWTDEMRVKLIADNGSVQRLDVPEDLKELYKTVSWP